MRPDAWAEPRPQEAEAARHTPQDDVIDVHAARLRQKVDDHSPQKLLHTVRGFSLVVREEQD
jgi:DNA-binding response OmpR family regulator